MGGHGLYYNRYPYAFNKFKAEDIRLQIGERFREIVAQYDNALYYNDYVVDEIIKRFRDKETLVIYVPDHGEANPLGTIHGGITAWLLDTAMGMVNYCYIGEGATPTVSMSINYIEAIKEGDEVLLISRIDRIGGYHRLSGGGRSGRPNKGALDRDLVQAASAQARGRAVQRDKSLSARYL